MIGVTHKQERRIKKKGGKAVGNLSICRDIRLQNEL